MNDPESDKTLAGRSTRPRGTGSRGPLQEGRIMGIHSLAAALASATAIAVGTSFGPISTGLASPPACFPSPAGLFLAADAVVEVAVKDARAWVEMWSGERRRFVPADYEIVDVFKGQLAGGIRLKLTNSCIDTPVPEEFKGYPMTERYCRGEIGLRLDGVRLRGGVAERADERTWILFLDRRTGEWRAISKSTSFRPGPCIASPGQVPPKDQPQFERLMRSLAFLSERHSEDEPGRAIDRFVIDPNRSGRSDAHIPTIYPKDSPRTPVINPCLRRNPRSGKMEWNDTLCPRRSR